MDFLTVLGSILAFIVIFSVIVLVHEWGHFTAARLFGVRVEEFGLGLPPKVRKLWKRGDTEYTLNWLPLGGFVRLYGEADLEGKLAKDPRSFSAKPVWQRIIIAGAGVFMNFVLAFVMLVIFFLAGGRPLAVVPDNAYPFNQPSYLIATESQAQANGLLKDNPDAKGAVLIQDILPGSAAEKAGLRVGMHIIGINGADVTTSTAAVEAMRTIPKGGTGSILTEEAGAITLTKTEDILGIAVPPLLKLEGYHLSFPAALEAGAQELGVQTTLLVQALGNLGTEIAKQGTIPDEVGGPVKIAEAVHMANKIGLDALLVMAILLSVNLGVLNLLPIPALDGGRIFFLLIEGVTRRRINPAWETRIHTAGYLLLMLLMVVVTGRDVWQLFT